MNPCTFVCVGLLQLLSGLSARQLPSSAVLVCQQQPLLPETFATAVRPDPTCGCMAERNQNAFSGRQIGVQ